jgi:triosephosphate isomerase
MKPLYLVANWKSNKTIEESIAWIQNFKSQSASWRTNLKLKEETKIIICAPFTVLASLKEEIEKAALPIHLGAQDISPFGKGAYTGEINADMLKGLIEYVLIGHSERRKYFQEKEEELSFEVLQSHSANFQTIYCIEKENEYVPASVDIIAYEPILAIGSGKAEDPKSANMLCEKIRQRNQQKPVLYGGSVTPENIKNYCEQPSINGVLVGGASLDAEIFSRLASGFQQVFSKEV